MKLQVIGKLPVAFLGFLFDKDGQVQGVFDGESYTINTGGPAYDLQAQHMTMFWYIEKPFKAGPEDLTMQKLLAIGK